MSLAARHSPNAEDPPRLVPHRSGRARSLGLPQPRAFAVPANTLVVADTFGFHARGPSVRPVAARRDLGLWQAQPVPAVGGARPVDDSALGRRSVLSWRFGDLLELAGSKDIAGGREPESPFDPANPGDGSFFVLC